jgi:hypothetical protein
LNPRPAWASAVREAPTALEALLSSSTPFLSRKGRAGVIPSGQIDIERVRDVNGGEAGVKALAWAPRVGEAEGQRDILAVAGGDRRVRIFNVSRRADSVTCMAHEVVC